MCPYYKGFARPHAGPCPLPWNFHRPERPNSICSPRISRIYRSIYRFSLCSNRCCGVRSGARNIENKIKIIILLTNNLTFGASTIAAIYKDRWQIEIFFKTLKQNLKVKTFVGTSENALYIQIWTAMIFYKTHSPLQLCTPPLRRLFPHSLALRFDTETRLLPFDFLRFPVVAKG